MLTESYSFNCFAAIWWLRNRTNPPRGVETRQTQLMRKKKYKYEEKENFYTKPVTRSSGLPKPPVCKTSLVAPKKKRQTRKRKYITTDIVLTIRIGATTWCSRRVRKRTWKCTDEDDFITTLRKRKRKVLLCVGDDVDEKEDIIGDPSYGNRKMKRRKKKNECKKKSKELSDFIGDDDYEVDEILDIRADNMTIGCLIKWNQDGSENWESLTLCSCEALVDAYWQSRIAPCTKYRTRDCDRSCSGWSLEHEKFMNICYVLGKNLELETSIKREKPHTPYLKLLDIRRNEHDLFFLVVVRARNGRNVLHWATKNEMNSKDIPMIRRFMRQTISRLCSVHSQFLHNCLEFFNDIPETMRVFYKVLDLMYPFVFRNIPPEYEFCDPTDREGEEEVIEYKDSIEPVVYDWDPIPSGTIARNLLYYPHCDFFSRFSSTKLTHVVLFNRVIYVDSSIVMFEIGKRCSSPTDTTEPCVFEVEFSDDFLSMFCSRRAHSHSADMQSYRTTEVTEFEDSMLSKTMLGQDSSVGMKALDISDDSMITVDEQLESETVTELVLSDSDTMLGTEVVSESEDSLILEADVEECEASSSAMRDLETEIGTENRPSNTPELVDEDDDDDSDVLVIDEEEPVLDLAVMANEWTAEDREMLRSMSENGVLALVRSVKKNSTQAAADAFAMLVSSIKTMDEERPCSPPFRVVNGETFLTHSIVMNIGDIVRRLGKIKKCWLARQKIIRRLALDDSENSITEDALRGRKRFRTGFDLSSPTPSKRRALCLTEASTSSDSFLPDLDENDEVEAVFRTAMKTGATIEEISVALEFFNAQAEKLAGRTKSRVKESNSNLDYLLERPGPSETSDEASSSKSGMSTGQGYRVSRTQTVPCDMQCKPSTSRCHEPEQTEMIWGEAFEPANESSSVKLVKSSTSSSMSRTCSFKFNESDSTSTYSVEKRRKLSASVYETAGPSTSEIARIDKFKAGSIEKINSSIYREQKITNTLKISQTEESQTTNCDEFGRKEISCSVKSDKPTTSQFNISEMLDVAVDEQKKSSTLGQKRKFFNIESRPLTPCSEEQESLSSKSNESVKTQSSQEALNNRDTRPSDMPTSFGPLHVAVPDKQFQPIYTVPSSPIPPQLPLLNRPGPPLLYSSENTLTAQMNAMCVPGPSTSSDLSSPVIPPKSLCQLPIADVLSNGTVSQSSSSTSMVMFHPSNDTTHASSPEKVSEQHQTVSGFSASAMMIARWSGNVKQTSSQVCVTPLHYNQQLGNISAQNMVQSPVNETPVMPSPATTTRNRNRRTATTPVRRNARTASKNMRKPFSRPSTSMGSPDHPSNSGYGFPSNSSNTFNGSHLAGRVTSGAMVTPGNKSNTSSGSKTTLFRPFDNPEESANPVVSGTPLVFNHFEMSNTPSTSSINNSMSLLATITQNWASTTMSNPVGSLLPSNSDNQPGQASSSSGPSRTSTSIFPVPGAAVFQALGNMNSLVNNGSFNIASQYMSSALMTAAAYHVMNSKKSENPTELRCSTFRTSHTFASSSYSSSSSSVPVFPPFSFTSANLPHGDNQMISLSNFMGPMLDVATMSSYFSGGSLPPNFFPNPDDTSNNRD
ncbi:unnamed protein product [Auanema sp. JU1783]|nr:unnamed protein product [Auanema sp. JU1783]